MSKAKSVIEDIRIANHFEWQGPLTRRELFFDREQQIGDALVTCMQVVNGAIGGVLVIGGRGSGKTSFLDQIVRELDTRKIPKVKISLDEGMVQKGNEMIFIKTLIDDLVRASEESELIEHKMAEKIIDILSGGLKSIEEVGVDIAGFSVVAKAAQDPAVTRFPYIVLRDGLKDFLKLIEKKGVQNTVKGAIILLDEGDALTLNKSLLQILRNVLQETPKIGLVVSGSNKIISDVSDVFSPIQRFFKKVELGPYPDEQIIYDAIAGPIALTKKELASKGVEFDIVHHVFDEIVARISGRVPLDINLLCHYAYDLGAKRASIEQNGKKVTIFMKADKELFDEAIRQLVGSREYSEFITELDKSETSCLMLLAKSLESITIDEMTALISLHEQGDKLCNMAVIDVGKRIENIVQEKEKTTKLLAAITQKGQKHKLNVLTSTLMGKPRFTLEDQWVRAYFKYESSDVDVDIDIGLVPRFGGIRVFGDPIASIVQTLFFPRLCDNFGEFGSFRAHYGVDSGNRLRAARGKKIACISYKRTATDTVSHIAFQVTEDSEIDWLKKVIDILMNSMQVAGLISSFNYTIKK